MGLWTTANQDEFDVVLKDFDRAVRGKYGDNNGYAFEAGYLRSLCIEMLASMPKRKQKQLIADMVRVTVKQQRAEEFETL